LMPYLAGSAITALWIVFGSIHRDQHSDSILNVLISLQHWTPYMWDQDRFGMLVPLLAIPIRNPIANMIFQAFVATFAGLSTFYLLARSVFRDSSYPLVGTIGAVSFLTLTPAYYRFEYLVDTNYGIGLALALWALILLEPGSRRRSWIGALLLMILAHWVNGVTAIFLAPFVILKGVCGFESPVRWFEPVILEPGMVFRDRLAILARISWRLETFRVLLVMAIGYVVGQLLTGLCPPDIFNPTNYSTLPIHEWPDSWWQMIETNRQAMGRPLWVASMAIELVVGLFGLTHSGRSRSKDAWWTAASLILTAIALWLLLGTRLWIKINAHAFRYLFVSALLIQTAVAWLAIQSMGSISPSRRKSWAIVATLSMLGASAWSYGFPSIAGVRHDIDKRFGAMTEDLLASHCTCIAGDYWRVWVTVFHVNLVRYEKGDPLPFWGLTLRAEPTFHVWSHQPIDNLAIAVANGDTLGENWLIAYPVAKFDLEEICPTIHVYRPVQARRRVP
jgi:hypothetical protein